MRTAICFSGLVGSTLGKSYIKKGNTNLCFKISSNLYKKNIIDLNNADVFVHSWSVELEDKVVEAYNPKKYLFEKQKIFKTPKYKILNKTPEARKQTHYSLQYSRMISANLKSEYEKEHNFKYDYVMLARFDLAWQTPLVFSEYDKEFIWVAKWPKKSLHGKILDDLRYWQLCDVPGVKEKMNNHWFGYPYDKNGLLGTWYLSNSSTIDKFATLYCKLDEYSLEGNCPLDSSGRISAHQQSLYHIEQIGMLDKLKFCDKNWHDDCPSVRRKYFKEK
jgi:hypothetical protein